jgi:hypothetical protein
MPLLKTPQSAFGLAAIGAAEAMPYI